MSSTADKQSAPSEQNRSARVALKWADGRGKGMDGKHVFRLGIGELRELQENTGHGPRSIYTRISSGTEFVDEVRETIRIGLIGGGATPADALALVERYVDGRPYIESCPVALTIIGGALIGAPEEAVDEDDVASKKADAAETTATISQTAASGSPTSTQPEQQSAAP